MRLLRLERRIYFWSVIFLKSRSLYSNDGYIFCGETFQGLTAEVLQSWNGSLYSLFETRFGLRMIRAQEKIRAVAADRNASEALKVPEGTPLLSVERVTYTYGDKPVEWRRGLYSTAEHFYLNELN